MKDNIVSHTILIVFSTVAIFLYSTNLSCSAETESHSSCYNEDWTKRAAFIRSYISLFKASKKEINLSEEQIGKLEEILVSCTKTCIKLKREIEEAEKAIDLLLLNLDDKNDKKVVIQKVKEFHALKARLDLSHFQLLGKAEELLTPEQKERLKGLPRPTFP